MNTMFLEVLQEVLSSLLITEPKWKGGMGGSEEEDSEPIGFWAGVDLHALGAMA